MVSRNYCFTSFNMDLFNSELINRLKVENPKNLRYMVFQIEECPSTRKLHAQGYLELSTSMRPAGVIKMLYSDSKLRVFERNGTREQAKHYAMCGGRPCECENAKNKIVKAGPYEYGVWIAGQGSSVKLATAIQTLELGATMSQLQIAHPETYTRHEKGLKSLQNAIIPLRDFQTELHIIFGRSGSGKTEAYKNELPKGSYYILPKGNAQQIWFDNYEPRIHENIIIENYDGWMPFNFLLSLCDSTPLYVPVRYGTIVFRAKRIYIISQYSPLMWYFPMNFHSGERHRMPNDPMALLRRITSIKHYEGTWPDNKISDLSYKTRAFVMQYNGVDLSPAKLIIPSYATEDSYRLFPKYLREC